MKGLCGYILMLSILILLFPGCQKQNDVPKHIFFIVIDTLRADHLGCYGYKQSTASAIDRLAKNGVLFKNAYSTASSTLESVFSFFTSNISLNYQIYNNEFLLSDHLLQKCLKSAGYNTMAIVSNPWLKTHQLLCKDGFIHYQFVANEWGQKGIHNTTDMVAQTTLDFLENKFNPREKNFLYIHYLDPHGPYRSPVNYSFFTGDLPQNPFVLAGRVHVLSGEHEVRARYKKNQNYTGIPTPKFLSERDLEYLVAQYDAEIRYVDSHLEKLLIKLEEMDVLKDSLIVVTADHGEEFLEHGCLAHGFQLYDETIHIPLIFYWKNKLTSQCKENLISGIDIAPTILELCQITPPASMLGNNAFSNKAKTEPVLFCTHFWNQDQKGMRTDKWKLIKNIRTGEIKIFDIENDPGEHNNLFDNNQKKWDDLFKTYEKLLSKHVSQKEEKEEKKLEIDPETREQLKALGYL